jgi:hypothetical protein
MGFCRDLSRERRTSITGTRDTATADAKKATIRIQNEVGGKEETADVWRIFRSQKSEDG